MPHADLLHSALHGVAAAAKKERVDALSDLGRMANGHLQDWRARPELVLLFARRLLRGSAIRVDLLPDATADAVVRLLELLRWLVEP